MRGLLRRLRGRLRIPQGLRVRPAERSVDRLRFAQQEHDASLRRLGRDRAFQFPDRARGRAHRRRARHRKHRRPQVRLRHALGRAAPRRLHPRRGIARGRVQLRERPRRRDRRTARARFARRRRDVHGIRRGRPRDHERDRVGRVPAPVHRGNGRQEPDHRHRERRPRPRGRRHRALGLRHGRAEVLRALAPLRAREGRGHAAREGRDRRSTRSGSETRPSARRGSARS